MPLRRSSSCLHVSPLLNQCCWCLGCPHQATELKLKVETAERERDFYFEKLRDIEILCQAPELQVHAVLACTALG